MLYSNHSRSKKIHKPLRCIHCKTQSCELARAVIVKSLMEWCCDSLLASSDVHFTVELRIVNKCVHLI